jgi:hypothetical protein
MLTPSGQCQGTLSHAKAGDNLPTLLIIGVSPPAVPALTTRGGWQLQLFFYLNTKIS